ncbi:MAG TPA: hypothetical protein VLB76_19395 [Thermoanaerobaculia bacterium]|nr:hypothetical protein [Thermoanaerobaculia bacterium]
MIIELPLPGWARWLLKELVWVLILGLFTNFIYDRLLRPLEASPVRTAEQVETRLDIAPNLLPSQSEPRGQAPAHNPEPTETPPVEPITFSDGTKADVHGLECRLSNGHSYPFRVVIFSEAYSWVYERDDRVQLNGQVLTGDDFVHRLESAKGLQEVLGKAHELVAVGTASCEGSEWTSEDDRAMNRAAELKAWIEDARSWPDNVSRPTRSLHTLGLGRYWHDRTQGQACDPAHPIDTSGQRKVILMAVLQHEAGTDLRSCIDQILHRDNQLRPLLSHYSRFDLDEAPTGASL